MRKGMTLEFKVTQQEITRLDSQKVYEKTKGYLYAHFVFSDDWEGYLKTVKFSNLLDNSYIGVTLASDNTCMVPYTLILYPGVTFCIEGNKDGDIITTNDFVFDVDESNSSVIPQDQPIYEIESKTLDYEKDGLTATLNVKSEVLEEVDNTLEITSEDFTIEDDKIVFNSDVANEIMGMNKRIKVDASIVTHTLQFTYIGLFTPRAIMEYPSISTYTIYEYSTTNHLLDEYRTTYIEFVWDKTTEKLYVDANNPTFEENHITGFRSDNTDGNINLTYDVEMHTPILNVLHINDFNIISTNPDVPSLEFNANSNNELESVVFMQNGYSADFTYTIPKGAKHYVVNELPTTDIDTTGNYYVMTESEDARGYLSKDIHNLTTTEYPPSTARTLRQDATVNSSDFVQLQATWVSDGNGYMGDFAIKFNIPCTVTVTLNPRQSSMAFMYIDINGVNVKIVYSGYTETYTRIFNVGETLCVRSANFNTSSNMYYKLSIQPYTIDGKIPLSTNVDEYINFENMWFKNSGGGSEVHMYHHYITLYDDYILVLYTNSATPLTTTNLITNYKGTFSGTHKVGTTANNITIHVEIHITSAITIYADKLDITNNTITSGPHSNMTVLSDVVTQIF